MATGITVTFFAAPASAAPAPSIDKVRKQVEQLSEQVGHAAEDYNASREKLKDLAVKAKAAKTRVAQQKKRVADGRRLIGQIAAEQYKSGGLGAMSALLSDDPTQALATAGLRVSLGERRAQAVAALVEAQAKLATEQQRLVAQTKAQAEETRRLAAARKHINAKLAVQKRLLDSLTEQQLAALARSSNASTEQALSDAGVDLPAGSSVTCDSVGINAPSARVAKVLAFACAQIGDPYVWGGSGPNSWDCSGLIQAAWAQVGYGLPHNARMQSGYGTRVSVSQLQPGDSIYFSNFGHAGIYIGKGLMVHAPRTGDRVKIASARMSMIIAATRF